MHHTAESEANAFILNDRQVAVLSPAVKIALVILHADPARGGAERYTIDLSLALRGRGHDVSLLASSFPTAQIRARDVLLHSAGLTRARRYGRFLDSLDRHLDQTHYDIVHAMLPVRRCDVYHPHAGIAVDAVHSGHLKYDAPLGRAVSRMSNRINARRQLFARVERELLQRPSPPTVLCLSEYLKATVRKYYSSPEAKLATLFNAVDLLKFDPMARTDAGLEIRHRFSIAKEQVVGLMIAQDFARKGLRQAIAALALTGNPRISLLVVGKQDPSAYRKFAEAQGVADRVIFAGPTSDPYAFYRAADYFVLPTRHDPCSLVVLEALAMGLPAISTVFNGACEIMREGMHGFVLNDPGDIQTLAQSMSLMIDPDRRQAMSQACLALRPSLSFDRHVDCLIEIYRNLEHDSDSSCSTRRT